MPAPVRGQVVASIGRIVADNKEALARLVTREVGKPLAEARGEVQEIVDTCDFFLGEGRRLYGETVPSEMPDKQLFTFRTPVGVAAVITAGNFPVAVPSWYLVPALLCGNAVVWKPAEYAAACAQAMYELFAAAGLPDGVLQVVQADGASTFDGLAAALAERLVDKVGFTGSTAVGERIGELCGRHLQSPCLELGGKNPMVVTASADLALAVEGALFAGFGTAGQRCTSLGTVLVHESVHAAFVAAFASAVSSPPRSVTRARASSTDRCSRHGSPSGTSPIWTGSGRRTGCSAPPAPGRITADNPRQGFVGDPVRRPVLPPGDRRRRRPGRPAVPGGDVRPDRRRHAVPRRWTRRSSWPTVPGTGCPRRSTPPTRPRRSGSGPASAPAWSR